MGWRVALTAPAPVAAALPSAVRELNMAAPVFVQAQQRQWQARQQAATLWLLKRWVEMGQTEVAGG